MRPRAPAALLAVVAALCGCSAPTPLCDRVPVLGGTPNGAPLAIAGRELRFDVTAPLAACASDTVRVEVEAFDDANDRVPVSAGAPVVRSGIVTATLSLTPTTPGVYAVKVWFEPSLGLVQLPVVVGVEPGVAPIEETFPVPLALCQGGLDRTPSGAVLCSSGTHTGVYRGGVEVMRFPGGGLVVADDVVWTQTGSVLERRVEVVDGGFELQGSADGFALTAGAALLGEHTRTSAVRIQSATRVRVARWEADAGALDVVEWNPGQVGDFAFLDGDTLWGVKADALVDLEKGETSLFFGGVVGGVGPEGLWFGDTSVSLLPRPFAAGAPDVSLPLPPELNLAPLLVGGTQNSGVPRLIRRGGDDPSQVHLVALREGRPTVEVWRLAGAPLAVGRRWIIAPTALPERVRFYPRPETTP